MKIDFGMVSTCDIMEVSFKVYYFSKGLLVSLN